MGKNGINLKGAGMKKYILGTFLIIVINLSGLSAGTRTDDLNRVLMPAVRAELKDIVELLLEKGADVNAVEKGQTPLMAAAFVGSKEMVELLLEKGATVNVVANHQTALKFATAFGFIEIVKLLLEARADVNLANSHEGSALINAVVSPGSIEMVKLLLKARADVDAVSTGGHGFETTAFSVARSPEIKQMLMRYKAFKFVKIDQGFDKEPELEDYFKKAEALTGTNSELDDMRIDQSMEQVKAFQKDHATYWHDKVQIAYEPFVFENNLAPLRTFLIQEISEKNGLILIFMRYFNSRKEFLNVLESLKPGATEQELERLQEIIALEKHIEEKEIDLGQYFSQENIAARSI